MGEEKACMFLVKQGFSILERNVSNKFGEIDIVAKKGSKHYFFEVKAGKKGGFINPAENLTKEKLRKFAVSVEHYALVNKVLDYQMQGIVVLLNGNEASVEIVDLS